MLKNNQGFTLLEMLMVMFIISILLLLVIPNITAHKDSASKEGCEAYAAMVQTQVTAFELATGELPSSLDELEASGYITQTTCSEGQTLTLSGKGEVKVDE